MGDDWRLLVTAAAAVLIAVGCTALPGVVAWVSAAVRRRPRPGVLGPLFWHELTALARRGQLPRLRVVYAVILLGGLFVTYLSEFEEVNPIELLFGTDRRFPIDRMSAFAQRFLTIFLFCQLAAIVLVTPVYAGGSVTEDRDRGTLEYLRSSMLTNRELVAAKLSARLAYIVGLIATGLPVLSLTFLFGGVAPDILIAGFTIALSATVSLAAFALYMGLSRPTLREVLYWGYGVVLVLSLIGVCCCCVPYLHLLSPFNATYQILQDGTAAAGGPAWLFVPERFVTTAVFVAVHGFVACLFTGLSVGRIRVPPPVWRAKAARVRMRGRRESDDDRPDPKPNTVYQDDTPQRRARPPLRSFVVPRLGPMDPLLWKERYFSGRLGGFERGVLTGCGAMAVGLVLLPVGLALFVAVTRSLQNEENIADILSPLLRWCGVGAAAVLAPFAGLRAAASVTREKERQTLDGLFTLPVTRRAILAAKWQAAAGWVKYWFVGLGVLAVITVISGGVHPVGLVSAAVLVVAFAGFTTTLALWLSVRCQTTARATAWYVGVLLALSVVPLPLSVLANSAYELFVGGESGVETAVRCGSVPFAVYYSLFEWDGARENLAVALTTAAAGVIYAAAAWVLWRAAVHGLESESR